MNESVTSFVLTPNAHSYDERHRATYRLGRALAEEELAGLLAFLERTPARDTIGEGELRALKNNVADALIAQNRLPGGLLETFLRIAGDATQDIVWREYLLQKLPDLALRRPDAEARTSATDFLRGQTESTGYILAGTAIIALERLGRLDPSLIGPDEIGRRASVILQNPDQADACKIAALQVLGLVDAEAGRREALAALADAARPIMLKVSALATLGACGQATDIRVVEGYSDSPDYRLRTAARAAAVKLSKSATAAGL